MANVSDDPIHVLSLSPLEADALPESVKKKLKKWSGPATGATHRYKLVLTGSKTQDDLVQRTLENVPRIIRLRDENLSAERIEEMLAILMQDAEIADVDREIEADNAVLRAGYLKTTPLLTSAQIHTASGAISGNKSETAWRWKNSGKIFSVPFKGVDLYPAFQFRDGKPIAAMKTVLSALPKDLSPWQLALWFASGNVWLGGAAPAEALNRPDDVLAAARSLADPAVG